MCSEKDLDLLSAILNDKYPVINHSHHAILLILSTYSSYKCTFVHFDIHHIISLLSAPCNHHSILCSYKISLFFLKIPHISDNIQYFLSLSGLFHLGCHKWPGFGKERLSPNVVVRVSFIPERAQQNSLHADPSAEVNVSTDCRGPLCSRRPRSCGWWWWLRLLTSWVAKTAEILLFSFFTCGKMF